MSIKIYKFEEQTPGKFNGGEILENRPIVMTDDGEGLQPYSNIFYWAHAWSDKGSTIGEHPHRAFEIMSFVLKGSIEHYDSKNREWIPLEAGDVQIIRSGSGITHSEKINPGSEMFQIWFDPDLSKTINQPATYNDYPAETFSIKEENEQVIRTYTGDGSNFELAAPGIGIREISFGAGKHEIEIGGGKIGSAYILYGKIKIDSSEAGANDFILIKDETSFKFGSTKEGKLFIIESPEKLPYKTYAERHN